jgi:hypothetical protein
MIWVGWVCVVALAALFAGSGCSEETSRGDTVARPAATAAAKQARTIRRVVRRAKSEATDGSARKTCRFITPEGQVRAIQAYSRRYGKPLTSCPQMVRFARKEEASYMRDARRAKVIRIRVSGDRATVTLEGPPSGNGDDLGGRVGLQLKKVGSAWRIDDADFVPYGTGE